VTFYSTSEYEITEYNFVSLH